MKTVMSNQKVPLYRKIQSALSIFRAHRDKIFSNAKNAIMCHQLLLSYLDNYLGFSVEKCRILDLGCGQTATQTALFHADGAKVIGIDIEVPTFRINIPIFFQVIRLNSFERALKSIARHILFDKSFFSELSKEYGKHINFDDIDTRIMNAGHLTFDSASFDYIFSLWVFEHINDIEAAVKEVNRVLSSSGIAVIFIHLFRSLSGGHCLEWGIPEQSPSIKVPPWDHLRNNKYPANTYLNKLTISQYRNIFQSYTNIVEEQITIEGERFLTKEIEAELIGKGYTREDLLTRDITFFAKKKIY